MAADINHNSYCVGYWLEQCEELRLLGVRGTAKTAQIILSHMHISFFKLVTLGCFGGCAKECSAP